MTPLDDPAPTAVRRVSTADVISYRVFRRRGAEPAVAILLRLALPHTIDFASSEVNGDINAQPKRDVKDEVMLPLLVY